MHESPPIMLVPLVILGLGSVLAGYIFKDLFMGYGSSQNFGVFNFLFKTIDY